MDRNDKNKIGGLVVTIAFHAMLIVALAFAYLYYRYSPEESEQLEPEKEEILFGGEYVMLGDVLQLETGAATIGGDVPEEKTDPIPMVTQKEESPMKVQPMDKVSDEPTAEELAAETERVRREKEEAEKSAKINKRMGGAFKNSFAEDNVSTGSTEESAIKRTTVGAPGVSGLEGYTLAGWGHPNSPVQGIVRVQVRVNSRGKVIKAQYVGGSGSAAGNPAVRRSCEDASMKSSFSVPENTTSEGVGEIIWRFENN